MKNKYIEIDFEFFDTSEEILELVCCSLSEYGSEEVEEYWLLDNPKAKSELVDRLNELKETHIFLAHAVTAEASSFYSLGLTPYEFKWIDTFLEFRCLTNHNHELQYGKHLIDGRIKTIYPKAKYEKADPNKPSDKLNHGLAQAVFKLLGKQIDTNHKTEMRNIIISGDKELIQKNKDSIQEYCTSDIVYLMPMLRKMVGHYKKLLEVQDFKNLTKFMLKRGETAAHTAVMERHGYPIAYNNLRNFTLQIPDILADCAEDINEQFPDAGVFVLNKRTGNYTKKEQPIREWIDSQPFSDNWERTKGGQYSLSLDAFAKFFTYRHSYPRGNFGAQILRYLKLKQSLNGFTTHKANGQKKDKTFWTNVGRDKMVRSYLNPYGSLTSRYQPPSTGFLFLKPAWMRSLCVPPKGKMVVGIDYKSEEFLISALFGRDRAMIEAYKSGDVYLAYAKDIGMVPQDATKANHPTERQSAKSAVLGISYLMTKIGLAHDMSEKLGREVTEEEAQEYIDGFDEAYEDHYEAVQDYLEEFSDRGYGILSDGWILFGDIDNFRSVANFPKQGTGGSILRRGVRYAHLKDLVVISPLHDALYFMVDLNDWDAVKRCCHVMRNAFVDEYKGTDMYEDSKSIMIDVEVWSPELEEGSKVISTEYGDQKVSVEEIHRDDRASDEYEKFKEYFSAPDWALL